MAKFYIARPPDHLGCFSLEEVVEKLHTGEFKTDDFAFKEGYPDWKKIIEIPELMERLKLLEEANDELPTPEPIIPAEMPPASVPMDQGVPTVGPPAPAPAAAATKKKKATRRISLPPKPSAKQTIRMNYPAGGPTAVPSPVPGSAPLSAAPEPTASPKKKGFFARIFGKKETEQVGFSAMAQGQLAAGASFVLDIWAHTESQTEQVKSRANELGRGNLKGTKQGVGITKGSVLEVHLNLPGFEVTDPVDLLTWNGDPVNASFPVTAPKDCAEGNHLGTATISSHGLMICKLHFQIEIGAIVHEASEDLTVKTERPRTAFASYSSQNRNEVLGCLQGMQKVAPDLDVDIDVISLRSGQDYREALGRLIPAKDVFFLFWSQAASESKEVEWEWRLALHNKGLGFIDPVPLEDPRRVPPPLELSSLHFGDKWISFKNATKQ